MQEAQIFNANICSACHRTNFTAQVTIIHHTDIYGASVMLFSIFVKNRSNIRAHLSNSHQHTNFTLHLISLCSRNTETVNIKRLKISNQTEPRWHVVYTYLYKAMLIAVNNTGPETLAGNTQTHKHNITERILKLKSRQLPKFFTEFNLFLFWIVCAVTVGECFCTVPDITTVIV